MTPNQQFVNALREVLRLDPLYGREESRSIYWPDIYNSLLNQPLDWESDEVLVANDGTRTVSMAERNHASATRPSRRAEWRTG